MKKILQYGSPALDIPLLSLFAGAATLYVGTAGDDATLPRIERNGHTLHAETSFWKTPDEGVPVVRTFLTG